MATLMQRSFRRKPVMSMADEPADRDGAIPTPAISAPLRHRA